MLLKTVFVIHASADECIVRLARKAQQLVWGRYKWNKSMHTQMRIEWMERVIKKEQYSTHRFAYTSLHTDSAWVWSCRIFDRTQNAHYIFFPLLLLLLFIRSLFGIPVIQANQQYFARFFHFIYLFNFLCAFLFLAYLLRIFISWNSATYMYMGLAVKISSRLSCYNVAAAFERMQLEKWWFPNI